MTVMRPFDGSKDRSSPHSLGRNDDRRRSTRRGLDSCVVHPHLGHALNQRAEYGNLPWHADCVDNPKHYVRFAGRRRRLRPTRWPHHLDDLRDFHRVYPDVRSRGPGEQRQLLSGSRRRVWSGRSNARSGHGSDGSCHRHDRREYWHQHRDLVSDNLYPCTGELRAWRLHRDHHEFGRVSENF